MSSPLYDSLKNYKNNNISFHMPGHKFKNVFNLDSIDLLSLDNTEVTGLDNLYEPSGIIEMGQNKMANKYGSYRTLFLTNGSTSGILASILTVCNPGDSLVVTRNCHHSVWNGLILGGINPIYINARHIPEYNLLGEIHPNDVERVFKENPDCKGIIIVSPTYEGIVSNIKEISSIAKKYKKILIVDEAHGAHFIWHKDLPNSAVEQGADIVIQSMHKNLPAIGQSALLHLNNKDISIEKLRQRLQMIQTSSPSYMMMGVMDYIREQMDLNPKVWEEYISNIKKIRDELSNLKNLKLLSKCSNISDLDISKIVISTFNTNITGVELSNILRDKYHIQVELDSINHVIALSTVSDTMDNLLALKEALFEIDKELKSKINTSYFSIYTNNETGYSPREVYFSNKEIINIKDSIGRISGSNIMIYPPGIPLMCIGQVFTQGVIDNILDNRESIIGVRKAKNDIFVSVVE